MYSIHIYFFGSYKGPERPCKPVTGIYSFFVVRASYRGLDVVYSH